MSVYDKAYELAKALASSPEYLQYLASREKLEQDETNYLMLQHYRRQQWEVQMVQMLGQEVAEEVAQELEQLYAFLSANPTVNEFLTAEYRFSRMMSDIQKIVGEAIGGWLIEDKSDKMYN